MAGSTLCVSCAQLPSKERSTAARSQRCPACQSDLGVTSYGAAFRMLPAKKNRLLTPTIFKFLFLGSGLFAFIVLLIGLSLWTTEQVAQPKPVLDPAPGEDLARIPVVGLEDPFPKSLSPADAKMRLSSLVAKIRHENAAKQDGFLLAHLDRRKELGGLPFVMGDACRIGMDRAQPFQTKVQAVRDSMDQDAIRGRANQSANESHTMFWNTYLAQTNGEGTKTDAGVAALTQILAPERRSLRASLVQKLSLSPSPLATRALAKAAIFDTDGTVRNDAVKALKDRPKDEYTEVLLQGIRYPLPIVAKRTAIAMILLDRKDLLPQLVDFLGEAPPGDPVATKANEQQVCTVREVVRVNHHRNCLLCHAPTETGSTGEVPGVIPIPGTPFPQSQSEAYGAAQGTDDPMVRADTTYLRQDFSVMMPVANAAPWPDMQRFDFLVRTRVVEGKELAALQHKVQQRPASFLSENHKAALRVLRELTGQDAGATQVAWQRVLGVEPAP